MNGWFSVVPLACNLAEDEKKKEQKYRIIVFLSKFSGDLVTL